MKLFLIAMYLFYSTHVHDIRMGEPKMMSRWYFGGLASAGACCFTHPLDTLKVVRGIFSAGANCLNNRLQDHKDSYIHIDNASDRGASTEIF